MKASDCGNTSAEFADIPQQTTFKYLEITVDQQEGCVKEVELKISEAWNRWREMTGVFSVTKEYQ